MPTAARNLLTPLPLLLVLLAAIGLAGAGDDEEPDGGGESETTINQQDVNWRRLSAMPLEQRRNLAEKLESFDRLSRAEKTAIRALDAKVNELPTADRANYHAVLRHYHLWLQSLPPEQRNEILAAPPSQRMSLVSKLRSQERTNAEAVAEATPLMFQLADLRGRSPFEVAHLLEVWFKLTPAQRTEVERMRPPERQKRLNELGRQIKVRPLGRLDSAEAEGTLKQLERNPQLKGWLRTQLKKAGTDQRMLDRQRLANNYHFILKPPRPVEASNLLRFETAMPSWLRASFDHLPPEEARRRLTILYRLIYPPPQEIPQGLAPASTPAPAARPAPTRPAASAGPNVPPPI